MTKPWKIVTTVLIAVVIPPGMAAWLVPTTGWLLPTLRSMAWDLSYSVPIWLGTFITTAVMLLWFALPWVGVVWLLLKIWKRKPPRITEGKG